MRIAAEMIATGATDRAIADRLGMPGNNGRMCVARHRVRHIAAPAKAIAIAAEKSRSAVEQRKAAVEAAERGELTDPSVYLTLGAITDSIRRVESRLDRIAHAAENDGQRVAAVSASGQLIRVAETRAKLGSVGGFAPPKAVAVEATQFNLVINLPGQSERFSFSQAADVPDAVIDASPTEAPAAISITSAGSAMVDQPAAGREGVQLGQLFGAKD
jgi:hypothetical protein